MILFLNDCKSRLFNTILGHILPLITATTKKIEFDLGPYSSIDLCRPLAEAFQKGLDKRFGKLFFHKHHRLATISNPSFKTKWLQSDSDEEKDIINLLKSEVEIMKIENSHSSNSEHFDNDTAAATAAITNSVFFFEDKNEKQKLNDEVKSYLSCTRRDLQSLKMFPTIEQIFRKYNTILASSASVERLFSLGKLVFGDNRQSLGDKNFEMQLLLKGNSKFYK